jgi:sn-glycerol 3-phosphate transport system permease protein
MKDHTFGAALPARSFRAWFRSRALPKELVPNILVVIISIAIGFPFFYMISTSFKTFLELHTIPITWFPSNLSPENYIAAWNGVPFAQFTVNSVVYTGTLVVGDFLIALLCGYAFGRLRFPKKDTIFFLVLLTMMIPGVITLIPRFLMLRDLGWINTYPGLIVPQLHSAFAAFLLRQHFQSLPEEVFDAAKIDGAGYVRQLFQVALPMSVPIATTVVLLSFVSHWNAYQWPLIVTNTQSMKVLPLGIQALKTLNSDVPTWNIAMAGATMVVLPVLVLFLVGQKKFFEGAVQGAIKG